jgi:TonB-dependent Receptor Plug Domain
MVNKIVLLCFICLTWFYSYPQTEYKPDIDQVAGQFIKMLRSDPKEKINFYTDKWLYLAGENLWFSAYCLNALSDRPLRTSKNLYVDLVNDKDSVISQALLNIWEYRTGGKLSLPLSMKEGNYWIRAYTARILREDSNRILVKPIYVLNARNPDPHGLSMARSKSIVDQSDSLAPQVFFFPEGGSIISGTTATVAFQCQTATGKAVDVSGFVTDSRDSVVANFKSTLPGIGKFSFDAWNPRKYVAHIKWANNRILNYPLPRIDQFASQISIIDQTEQAYHVRISQGDSLYKKNISTHLIGISRDSLCFAANGSDMYELNISKNNFPKGKGILFLFDDQGRIVSQRAIYTDSSSLHVSMVTDKTMYGPREKVKLDLGVSGMDNQPINALFSVSVTDDRLSKQMTEQGQRSYSNLDEIQFSHTSSTTGTEQKKTYSSEELDLLMLVQKNQYAGWKYGDQFVQDTNNSKLADTSILSIRGRILSKKNEPLIGYLVDLFSDQKDMFRVDTTDDKGRFIFNLPDYDDGSKFNLKLTNFKGKAQEGKVIMDNQSFPLISTPVQLKNRFKPSELEAIRNFRAHHLDTLSTELQNGSLSPVTVKTQKPQATSYDESKRVSRFSYIITSDNFQNGDNFAVVNAVKNVPGFNVLSSMSQTHLGVQPMVIMDGVAQSLMSTDVNSYLMSLDPASIDFIEILKGAQTAIYGIEGAGGVILINSLKTRKDVAQIDEKGLSTIFPKGYTKESGFTNPDYDKKEAKKDPFPDLRSTVYWKGKILTDAKGRASVEFFTSDEPTTYTVSVMGVTITGEMVYQQVKIKHR